MDGSARSKSSRNYDVAFIEVDGDFKKVRLRYHKGEPKEVKKRTRKRIGPKLIGDKDIMKKCAEASPPLSPQEQRRKGLLLGMRQRYTGYPKASACYKGEHPGLRDVLWKTMVKRVPKLITPVDHSVWAMQELTDVNTKCLRTAALGLPEEFPRLIIRAPVPWHQQYLVAREFAYHNLFVTHPVALEIRRLWNHRYRHCRLIGRSWDRHESHTPEGLLRNLKKRCDYLRRSLTLNWLPECSATLTRMKSTWASMVPLKHGESMQQITRFLNSISWLVALQIRRLLYTWMEEWLGLVKTYEGDNDEEPYGDMLYQVSPLIQVQLKVTGYQIYFDPKLEVIHECMEKILKTIVRVSRKLPRIEKHLLPGYNPDVEWLMSISWDEDRVQDVLDQVREVIETNRKGPRKYIKHTYDNFMPILLQPFLESFDDLRPPHSWDEAEKTFKDRFERLNEIKKDLKQLRTHVYLKLFYLDCRSLNAYMISFLEEIKGKLITRILNENRRRVRTVCTRFETVTERVSRVPLTTADLVDSISFVAQSQSVSLPEMMDDVKASGRRLLMLLNYTVLNDDDVSLSCRLFHWPKDLDSVLQVSAGRLQRIRVETERSLKERIQAFLEKVSEYSVTLENFKSKESITIATEEMRQSTALLQDLHEKLQSATEELSAINNDEQLLEWPVTEAPDLPRLIQLIAPYHRLWHVAYKFHQSHDIWYHGPFKPLDSHAIAAEIGSMHEQMIQLGTVFADVPGAKRVADTIRKRIEKFVGFLPLLHAVCNKGLRERHWQLISKNFESPMYPEPDTSLAELVAAGLMQFIKHIEEVSVTATKEFALEETLHRMQSEWNDVRFEFLPYRDSDVCVLTGVEEIQALVDDHILRAQTMHASPYIAPLEPLLQSWEEQLVGVQDTIDVWLKVQSTWLYLEPIFSSEDIQRQMASDAAKFEQVDGMWRSLMASVTSEPGVLQAVARSGLLDELRKAFDILEDIQKGLHDYLEKKRVFFSRFYFLSNDELLEILSKTKEPQRIQPHLRKCFDGIGRLLFNDQQEIEAMISEGSTEKEREVVYFRETIVPAKSKGMVELWMSEVDDAMKDALVHYTHEAMLNWNPTMDMEYLMKYPGQCVYCAASLRWTEIIESTIQSGAPWSDVESMTTGILNHLISLITSGPNPVARVTLSNLIMFYLHGRDTVQKLKSKYVSSVDDFHWQRNLRFYWNDDEIEGLGHLTVAMLETLVPYGFEYMGNTFRLVITPSTEKGFEVIMLALKQYQGAWLHGVQGIGKTETIKELARTLAKQCLVFNCFNGLDTQSLGRLLKGVAQSGAWSCFDDLDQVSPEVVSIMAVQIQIIQTALSRRLRRVGFEGSDIQMSPGSAVFITTKTRDRLPDTFRSLFRLATIVAPDIQHVIKISLLSQGFQTYQALSPRLFKLMLDISEKIPDVATSMNLRSIREILKLSSKLKNEFSSSDEMAVIRESVVTFFSPQLNSEQNKVLIELVNGLFSSPDDLSYDKTRLLEIIKDICKEMGLEHGDEFTGKVRQLYETLATRAGVILLGPTLSGKSTIYKVVAKIYSKLVAGRENSEEGRVASFVISPWSLPSKYLYEWHDPEKAKWHDGIITKALRELSANSPTSPRWLILDGHVHSELVGHLHTLLDGGRKLALPSGEILQIPLSLRIIFETCDLTYASPSTISRCGIVRVPDGLVSIESFYKSWAKRYKFPREVRPVMVNFVKHIVRPTLKFVHDSSEMCAFIVTSPYLFLSFTRLINAILASDSYSTIKPLTMLKLLTFSAVWTMGSMFKGNAKNWFNQQYRDLFKSPEAIRELGPDIHEALPPPDESVFAYKYEVSKAEWKLWRDDIPPIPRNIEQPRVLVVNESVAIQYFFVKTYINGAIPVMIIGPTGVGKSQVTRISMEDLPKDRFVHNIVHVTSVSTSSSLLNSIMTGLDRRRKGVYGPALGRRCVLFIDDLIACEPVEGNIRTPLEMIRHWLSYECVYDAKSATKKELVDMQVVTSVRLDHQFHEEFDVRLLRHMNAIYIENFTKDDVVTTVTSILVKHFSQGFSNAIARLAKNLAMATIEMHAIWQEKEDEDNVPHYTVDISCVYRVVQGLMNVPASNLGNANKAYRLWVHEVCRVWADRLQTSDDRKWFLSHVDRLCSTYFKQGLDQLLFASSIETTNLISLPKIYFSNMPRKDSAESIYDEVTEMDAMISTMEQKLELYNQTLKGTPLKLVFSLNVAGHVLHVIHALSRPKGHVILVGEAGRGRRSCAIVSALLLNYEIFQVKVGRKYGLNDWKEDVKQLIRRTGVMLEKILFVCNAADFQSNRIYFDYIGRLVSGFEIPELFTNEERTEMVELYLKHTKENGKFAQILANVEENLRIALCVSPRDPSYAQLSQYPTIFTYSAVLWFDPWPEETLEAIAKKYLEEMPGLHADLQACYLNYFKTVHNSMRAFSKTKGMIQQSCAAYLEMLSTFRTLWTRKEKDLLQQKERYNAGLNKLQFAASQVVVMQEELRRLQPQLVETSAETESLMVKIEQDTIEVEAQKEIIAADESLANEAAAAAQAIKDECESDLAEATPALEAAINALDTLKPADITLVKSMRHPPYIVRLVMEAVCVMKQIAPVKKLEMSTGKTVDDYWQAAQKLLGDLRFLDLLRAYDKDNIPPGVMKRIREKYIPNPEFNPNIVRHVSAACEGLCRWVRAMEVYDRVIKIVSPKRAKLQEAEEELARQMKRLSEKHTQLQQISDKLQGLNDDFAAMSKKKKDLEDSIDQCRQKMERAEKLIGGLGGEQDNWRNSSNNLDFLLQKLPGDVLLSSSIITYLGAVKESHRTECIAQWLKLIETLVVPHSDTFSLVDCLIDHVKIRAWNLAGLPMDKYSLDSGIISTHCQRWPLLIDPQDQGLKWILEIESRNNVQVIRYDEPHYISILIHCISQGRSAVLVNVKDKLDPELDHVLAKAFYTVGDKTVVQVGNHLVDWSSRFRLFLITKEEDSATNIELTSKLTVVNFTLSYEGLEEKFLSLFLANERPELEDQKQMLMVQSASNQRQIRDLEDRILYVLSSSRGNILEDETATKTLYNSKITSESITVKQAEIQISEQEIDQVRESYRPVAANAAALYGCIGQLKYLNKVYQFALPWFINLFQHSATSSQGSNITTERIHFVNDHFTRTVHHSICRALFHRDRHPFSVLLALAALKSKHNIKQDTVNKLFAEPDILESNWLGPSWIEPNQWQHLMHLSKSVDRLKDLPVHIERNPIEWQNFCQSPDDDDDLKLPEPWNECGPLEQLLITKYLKPDALSTAMNNLIKSVLGVNYSETVTSGDVVGAHEESKAIVPILCFVAGNIDPLQGICNLSDSKLENRNRVKFFTLGRGSDRNVYPFVRRCADEGNWAVIQNMHLYPEVVDHVLDEFERDPKEFTEEFRVWMIGYSSSKYSSRALQYCVKTVCEPPICVRDALLEILTLDFVQSFSMSRAANADTSFQPVNPAQVEKENVLFRSEPWKRISLGLYCFHALYLERKRYETLGFSSNVELTYYDLRSALTLVKDAMLSSKDISLASLRSLVVDCVYRSQITNDSDLTVLRKFIDNIINNTILQSDRITISVCGKYGVPYVLGRKILIDAILSLPADLGPEAVGLTRDSVKQRKAQESVDLLRKINCCSNSLET